MGMNVLPTCMYAFWIHMCDCWISWNWIYNGCMARCGYWESNPSPLLLLRYS